MTHPGRGPSDPYRGPSPVPHEADPDFTIPGPTWSPMQHQELEGLTYMRMALCLHCGCLFPAVEDPSWTGAYIGPDCPARRQT